MNSKELRLFRESYASIRKPQTENIQEGEMEQQGQVERYRREAIKRDQERKMRREREQSGMKAGPNKPETQTNSADLFDIVKGHLMSEGYADTEEAALAIMANMSEEWRQSIVEEAPKRIQLQPANRRLMKDAGPARVHDPNTPKKVIRVEKA